MFKRKTIVVVSICLLVPLLLLVIRFGIGGWSAGSLTVSRQTTFIEGPMPASGYPDYIAALNEELSDGVTPENNAAALLLRAMGPGDIPPGIQAKFYKKMGMSPMTPSDCFIAWADYCKAVPEGELPQLVNGGPTNQADPIESLIETADKAGERPWGREEFPHLAKWLEANAAALDMITAASKLPRYYAPLISEQDPPTLFSVLLPLTQQSRRAAQALVVRAMLRLNEKQYQAAWDDLMACRRLGRLAGNGAFLVDALVGYAIEGMGMEGQKQFLAEADLTADEWVTLQMEIEALRPLPSLAHKFDRGERFNVLNLILTVAQQGPKVFEGATGQNLDNPITRVLFRGVDWNIPLETLNEWMDRFVAAAKMDDPELRAAETAKIEAEIRVLAAGIKQPHGIMAAIVSRAVASKKVGDWFVVMVCPAISAVFQAEARVRTNDDLVRVGIALGRFERDHGEFPETLDKLTPAYMETVPVDALAGSPLVYKRRAARVSGTQGYLLYSIGANQVDEEGKGHDQNGDDFAIEIPPNQKISSAEPSEDMTPEQESSEAPKNE